MESGGRFRAFGRSQVCPKLRPTCDGFDVPHLLHPHIPRDDIVALVRVRLNASQRQRDRERPTLDRQDRQ